jgi:hypothetical protein
VAPGGIDEAWMNGIHCQRFGQTGSLQRLFEVVPTDIEETKPEMEEFTMVYFDRLRQDIQMENEKAAVKIHEQFRFFGNMWLKRTE